MTEQQRERFPRHHCGRVHKSWRTLVQCELKNLRAIWIVGEGPFLTYAYCGGLTVMLHADLESALQGLVCIDRSGCGGRCQGEGRHYLRRIDADGRIRPLDEEAEAVRSPGRAAYEESQRRWKAAEDKLAREGKSIYTLGQLMRAYEDDA